MIQIKPKKISFPEIEINEIEIRTMPTSMNVTSSQVYWQVFNVVTEEPIAPTTGENSKIEIKVNRKAVADGNIDIPEEVYMNWLDDSTIIDYVLKILNLEIL